MTMKQNHKEILRKVYFKYLDIWVKIEEKKIDKIPKWYDLDDLEFLEYYYNKYFQKETNFFEKRKEYEKETKNKLIPFLKRRLKEIEQIINEV